MAATNEVEIRFHIEQDAKTAPAAALSKSASPAETRPQEMTQKERDVERKMEHVTHTHSKWERVEHRIEHKMRHIGSRLIAAQLVEEGADVLGIGHSFASRIGEHAIEGFMMAGPTGAALKTVGAIVHQLAEIVKAHSEELKRAKLILQQQEERSRQDFQDFRIELQRRALELADETRKQLDAEREHFNDYIANAYRFINVPYLGRG